MKKLAATYEVYNVRARDMKDYGASDAPDDAWGYEVCLWRGGELLDIYDSESIGEADRRIGRKAALEAARAVVSDVKAGHAGKWFEGVAA